MGASQSEIKEDVAEYLFQRMNQLKDNFVLVSNYLQKHNERCDVLSTHLVNCESWMRKMKDDVLRREVINVRAELLEEKYTRKMDLQKLEEAEENINLMLLFFEKFGVKLTGSGKELKNVDANLIASVEQGAKDRRTVDLLKQKTLLQDQLAEKNEELKRTQDLMKLEAKASSSKKDEEFHLLVSKQSATINDLRAQILKLSEENSKLLSEQLVQSTEKEKNRSRKKEKKLAEEKKDQGKEEPEKDKNMTNAPSRSSSQPPAKENQQRPPDDQEGEGNFNQQNWRGGFRGNRGFRGQRNYGPNQGGRGYHNSERGRGNYQQNANVNYGRGRPWRGSFQRGPEGLLPVANLPNDLSPEALLSLVREQQAIINGFQPQNVNFQNPNYGRGHVQYDGNQRRGFGGHPRPFQRGGPAVERQASSSEKELSPEALLSLIKEQQATINEFHSQNLKLHEDNTKLVAHQMAQALVKKEKKKVNKRKEHADSENKSEELSNEKQASQDKEDRIFACDRCGQISSDFYSLQIHVAFCSTEEH